MFPSGPPPCSAYVHVPFCARRCGYCNFTVVAGRNDLIETFLRALQKELSCLQRPRAVDTLFVGGGTPTQLSPRQLSRLFGLLARWFPLRPNAEFTVEANPADITAERMDVLSDAGVNRVSLGAQSFDSEKLSALERDHTAADVERSFRLVAQRGMSVSLDLIFGVPGETLEVWQNDLAHAVQIGAVHVSTYGLTLERGTTFWSRHRKGQLIPPAEESQRSMYLAAIDGLTRAGWEHYEVSNFARTGNRCRHNEVYWRGQPYYGVGPGAARYVDGVRETNHRSTTTYLKRVLAGKSPVAESERLTPEARARETLILGLRRMQGVDEAEFSRQTGYGIHQLVGREAAKHVQLGLLSWDGTRLRLTREGLLVSDSIWPDFL